MLERTRRLWSKQDQHTGDRHRLFTAVSEAVPAETVLYPGSYVDVAPSFVWPAVTYVDVDERAMQFFGDRQGIDELLVEHGADPDTHTVRFVHADYTDDLDLPESSVDLLVSLYGGLISEHCTHHLRVGGHLLVNPSHGDVAMASIDPRYRLRGVVASHAGRYSVRTNDLDTYLVPKRDIDIRSIYCTRPDVASPTPSHRSRTCSSAWPDDDGCERRPASGVRGEARARARR